MTTLAKWIFKAKSTKIEKKKGLLHPQTKIVFLEKIGNDNLMQWIW